MKTKASNLPTKQRWEKQKSCPHLMREHNVEDLAIILCRLCFDRQYEEARNEGHREAFDDLVEVLTKKGILNVTRAELVEILGYSNAHSA